MQFKIRLINLCILFLATSSLQAESANYLGIDYDVISLHGRDERNYAMRLVLPETYHGYEAYYAHRFDNDVGLGFGWSETGNSTKGHTFAANELFVGGTMAAGDRTNVSAKIQQFHLDLNGYLNVTPNIEAFGQLGVAWMRLKMTGYTFASGVTTNMMPSSNFDNLIPRVTLGIQYFTQYKIGLRALVGWQATNIYHMTITDQDGLRLKIRPLKQGWTCGIGLVGKF